LECGGLTPLYSCRHDKILRFDRRMISAAEDCESFLVPAVPFCSFPELLLFPPA